MAAKKPAKKRSTTRGSAKGFTAEEKAAMKERARELKAQGTRAEGERDLLAKIAEMPKAERAMAKKLHAIVSAGAPDLAPKTWYGMPAYANSQGKVVCFFQPASKFKSRYSTLGFNDAANLDKGAMWPTTFALKELGEPEKKTITQLVKQAVR